MQTAESPAMPLEGASVSVISVTTNPQSAPTPPPPTKAAPPPAPSIATRLRDSFTKAKSNLQTQLKTPDGLLSIRILPNERFMAAHDLRFQFNFKEHTDWCDWKEPQVTLECFVDKDDEKKSLNELEVEAHDQTTNEFFGSGAIPISMTPQLKQAGARSVELTGTDSQKVGDIDLVLDYKPFTRIDTFMMQLEQVFIKYPRSKVEQALPQIKLLSRLALEFFLSTVISNDYSAFVLVLAVSLTPFWFFTMFTETSWAFRQWLLIVPLFTYLFFHLPTVLGSVFSYVATRFVLYGHPLRCEAIHTSTWVQDKAFHVRVTLQELSMDNPPGYPLKDFFCCNRIDLKFFITFADLRDTLTWRFKPLRLPKIDDYKYLAKVNFEFLELDGFLLDFQLHDGLLNIWEIVHILANRSARQQSEKDGIRYAADPMPNELEIHVIRAVDLRHTKDKSRSFLKAAKESSSPMHRIALVDAIIDEVSDDDDNAADHTAEGSKLTQKGFLGRHKKVKQEEIANAVKQVDVVEEPQSQRSLLYSDDLEYKVKQYDWLMLPEFNPMDLSVEPEDDEEEFDPYVVVHLRRDNQTTKTQTKTNSPMINETFYFHATDAGAMILVEVFNRTATGSMLLGQWSMGLKYLLTDPEYCWHEDGLEVTEDRWVRGWFPLMNADKRGIGLCGKLEMALQWRYVPEYTLQRRVSFPQMSAIDQLNEVSVELLLRIGDLGRIKYWLNHLPFLFEIDRMTLRNMKLSLNDLFRPGSQGQADRKGVDAVHLVSIEQLDWVTEFKPKRKGLVGITAFDVLIRIFTGLSPKIMNPAKSGANLGRTIGSIVGMAGPQITHNVAEGVRHIAKGEPPGPIRAVGRGVKHLAKSLATSLQVTHQHVTLNASNDAQFKVPVDATDDDLLLPDPPRLRGELARYATATDRKLETEEDLLDDTDMEHEVLNKKASFHTKYFELRGHTLFYRGIKESPGHVYDLTYKIPLHQILYAIYFTEQHEIILNMGTFLTRLRLNNDQEEEAKHTEELQPSLEAWMQALQENGVDCRVKQQ